MEIFNAIGLFLPKDKTLNDLAADAEKLGEASIYAHSDCTLYGRCWRIGAGLEVWTILYKSETGEVFNAGCRPAFRARYTQTIENWSLYEDRREGEAAVRGFIEDSGAEIFFQLQNLTETEAKNFDLETLRVGLGGLVVRAEISAAEEFLWQPLHETTERIQIEQTYQRLGGKILAFETLRNRHSETDLYWIYLELKDFNLEILVNQTDLQSESGLRIGAFIKADVWLQGHIVSRPLRFLSYEGVDWSVSTVDFWKHFKRLN